MRKKLSKIRSKKQFKKRSGKTKTINVTPKVMRGGFHL